MPPSSRGTDERADPIGDAVHEPVEAWCIAIRTACCRSSRIPARPTAASASAARPSEPGDAVAVRAGAAFEYIAARPEIWEVILSGGDPLVLSDRRLRDVAGRLAAIPHVKILRVHTRVPVVDPERITPTLARALNASGKATYVVLHANHPGELRVSARAACARLIDAGIPMLSQTVLLRGVNDNAQTLGELMRAFVECRIKPYYLHHGDLAPGTAHFRTSIAEGQDDARARAAHVGIVSADLRPRHSGRARQIAHRPELSRRGATIRALCRRRFFGPPARVSAGLMAIMPSLRAAAVIRLLDLKPHPEGGHYRETFRDVRTIDGRAASTAIYFLLARGERSHWHRIDAVEMWHYYAGAPLALSIAEAAQTTVVRLGNDLAAGERPQAPCRPAPGRRQKVLAPGPWWAARWRRVSTL